MNLDNLSRVFLIGVGFIAILIGIFGSGKLRGLASMLVAL